jgi:ABC-type iron transport system FetAB ATPase subunit
MISLNGNSIPLDVGLQEDVTGIFNAVDKLCTLIAFNTSIILWDERQMQVVKVEDYMQQVAFIGSTSNNSALVYLNMKNQLFTYSLETERPSLLPTEKDKEIHSFAVATTGGGEFLGVSYWSE